MAEPDHIVALGRIVLRPDASRLRFVWLALLSRIQARLSRGNIYASARSGGDGRTFHSLSVWTSEYAMRAYARSGAHRRAMQASRDMAAQVEFVHWRASVAPDWPTALARLPEDDSRRAKGANAAGS